MRRASGSCSIARRCSSAPPKWRRPSSAARMMRGRANDYWKKYYSALPQGPAEKQLAEASNAKRLALQNVSTRVWKPSRPNDQARIIATAKAMQVDLQRTCRPPTMRCAGSSSTKAPARATKRPAQLRRLFRTFSLLAIAAGLAAAGFSWFSLRRAIGRPLDEALGHFEAIAVGRPAPHRSYATSRDEMGLLLARSREDAGQPRHDGRRRAFAAANRSRRRPRRSRPAISTCRRARKSRRRRCRKRRRAWRS